ncbi:hypothetical protein ACI65C_006502 [Semiaphis heraclei]
MDRYIVQSLPKTKRARLQTDENVDDPLTGTEIPPTSSTENVPQNCFKFQYLFEEFYKLLSTNGDKIMASCVTCHKRISASTKSSGNLLSHIKIQHSVLMPKVEIARSKKSSNPASNVIQTKIDDVRPKKINKDMVKDLVFEYIVNEMRPLRTCEKKSFKKMTCHFIDEETYVRQSYVIGCIRIKGSHNYQNITEVITEIAKTYKIDLSKITHIVTDNASNFGKAFRVFSSLPNHEASTSDLGNFGENSSESSNFDSGSDCSDLDSERVNLNNLLNVESNIGNNGSFFLPQHMLCCAHTLNLIAANDISKISNNDYNKISKSTFNKLSNFWNLASRSTAASDTIYDVCKCKFPVPVVTRWNSLYDATQKISNHKINVDILFEKLHLPKLKVSEWAFIEEYCNVMKPLAFSLDKLQGEKNSYLGYVAPTLLALRKLLIQFNQLTYCKPLSLAIVTSLEKRFSFLYNLREPKSKSFIIASISHPKFKMDWVPVRYRDLCKKMFIDECNLMSSLITTTNSDSADDSDNMSDKEFYNIIALINDLKEPTEISASNGETYKKQEIILIDKGLKTKSMLQSLGGTSVPDDAAQTSET